jgi:Winged helix DNA-binding domain
MLTMPLESFEVPLAQERGFALRRHILDGTAGHEPYEVAAALVGLHAARLSSPWVAMRARVAEFESADLRRPLVEEPSLIKLRCMRRTLHILPFDLAAVAHTARLDQRLGHVLATLKRSGHTERSLRTAASHVLDAATGGLRPYRDLERAVTAAHPKAVELIRLAIRWLWERGELVYQDLSPSLHHEQRAFARAADAAPGLDLAAHAPTDAKNALVRAHIAGYGPVSVNDIVWWSGLRRSEVTSALNHHREELIGVRIPTIRDEVLLMDHAGAGALLAADAADPEHVTLLGHEDPALKGYFNTRARYVDDAGYARLFNPIGEARASVMIGGAIAGVWTWDRRRRRIATDLFRRLPNQLASALKERVASMEAFLRADPVSGRS